MAHQIEMPGDMAPKSKYTILDLPNGFDLCRDGGLTFRITYADTWLHGEVVGRSPGNGSDDPIEPLRIGLYDPKIMQQLAEFMLKAIWGVRYVRRAAGMQGTEMIVRALGRRVGEAVNRIRHFIAPPEVNKLAMLMFHSTYQDAEILHLPELYTSDWKYVYQDLERYTACRMYAKWVTNTNPFARRDEAGFDWLADVARWRDVLLPSRNKFGNQTLDHFPDGVSFHSIQNLALLDQFNVVFKRPVTTRLHMLAVLESVDNGIHAQTALDADDQQVIDAAAVFSVPIKRRDKSATVCDVMRRIYDYPEAHHGDLVGLARKSLRWHNDARFRRRFQRAPLSRTNEATALPPVDLEPLAEAGITFLADRHAVENEGNDMDHCIASYAPKAIRGECFLFHVEHDGDRASIEVTPDGTIRQAYGPHDTVNPACEWGKNKLAMAWRQYEDELRRRQAADTADHWKESL